MRGQGRTGVVPVTLFLGAAGAGAGVWVFVACPTALTDTWVPALLHTEHKKQILHQLTLAALGAPSADCAHASQNARLQATHSLHSRLEVAAQLSAQVGHVT